MENNLKVWTPDDIKTFNDLVSVGTSIPEIAKKLNRSEFSVALKLIKNKTFEFDSLMECYGITPQMTKYSTSTLQIRKHEICEILNIEQKNRTIVLPPVFINFFIITKNNDKFSIIFSRRNSNGYCVIPFTNMNLIQEFYSKFEKKEFYNNEILDDVIEFIFSRKNS